MHPFHLSVCSRRQITWREISMQHDILSWGRGDPWKRKRKTLHGSSLRGWFLLINRKRTSWRKAAYTEEEYNMLGQMRAESAQLYPYQFFFPLTLFSMFSTTTIPQTEATSTRQKQQCRNKKPQKHVYLWIRSSGKNFHWQVLDTGTNQMNHTFLRLVFCKTWIFIRKRRATFSLLQQQTCRWVSHVSGVHRSVLLTFYDYMIL